MGLPGLQVVLEGRRPHGSDGCCAQHVHNPPVCRRCLLLLLGWLSSANGLPPGMARLRERERREGAWFTLQLLSCHLCYSVGWWWATKRGGAPIACLCIGVWRCLEAAIWLCTGCWVVA